MRKQLSYLLCASVVICSGSVFTFENVAASEMVQDETISAESEEKEQQEDVLTQIDEVNDLDNLLTQYGSMTLKYEYPQEDLEKTVFLTEDSYVEIDNDGFILVDGDEIYGRDSEEETDYFKMACFTDADYDVFQDNYEQIPWYTSDLLNGKAEVREEENNLIITVSQEIPEEDKEILAETYSVEAEEIEGCEYYLEADPETKVISRIVYSLDCGSTGIMLNSIDAEFETDQPELPLEMDDFLNEKEVRTITFIIEPGTEEETTYEDTIRKGCSYRLITKTYDMYSDKECTQAYASSTDLSADVTIYLKTKE